MRRVSANIAGVNLLRVGTDAVDAHKKLIYLMDAGRELYGWMSARMVLGVM